MATELAAHDPSIHGSMDSSRDRAKAQRLHDDLVKLLELARRVWFEVAKLLYELERTEAWRHLGFKSWTDYLNSKPIGLSQPYAQQLTMIWRDLVLDGPRLQPAQLRELTTGKCVAMLPHVREDRDELFWHRMLADARTMPIGEFRETYAFKRGNYDKPPRKCPHCGGEL